MTKMDYKFRREFYKPFYKELNRFRQSDYAWEKENKIDYFIEIWYRDYAIISGMVVIKKYIIKERTLNELKTTNTY